MDQPMIEVEHLTRSFRGGVRALDGLSLRVPAGVVYGLLGPNGAGKTTLIRVLATLLPVQSGTARVAGCDVRSDPAGVRARIGLAGQYAAVDDYLTGRENVEMVGLLYGLRRRAARHRAAEVLERIGLAAAADRQVRTYSGGMRRRLDLAATLVGAPVVVFLDEPTTGVDPASRRDLWALIRDLVSAGTTVLLTTQQLAEADWLADRIAVLDRGRVVREGTAGELKDQVGGAVVEVGVPSRDRARTLAALAGAGTQPGIRRGIRDVAVLTRRNLLHTVRLPGVLVISSIMPVVFVLMFSSVFGGAIAGVLPPAADGKYVNWLVPGLLAQFALFAGSGTAAGLADDLAKGSVDRFRSLPIARAAVLTGRTVSDLSRSALTLLLMTTVGYLLGFRWQTHPFGLLAGIGVALLFGYAWSWAMAVVGLLVRTAEAVQAAVYTVVFPLGFTSAVFVPAQTMPGWLRPFAEHQPVTVTANAVRGLMLGEGALPAGQTVGGQVALTLLWAGAITVVCVPLAVRAYRHAVR